jgi:hypothetical protein
MAIDIQDGAQRTALHHATAAGEEKAVALLLDHGADPNAPSALNITPLHLAAMAGKTEVAGLLTRRGARVNSRTIQGMTPLHLAADDRMVNCLVDAGADINSRSEEGLTPLQTAMELASVESLEQVGGLAIHSVMLGRLRGLLGQMPLSITNISHNPIEHVVIIGQSPACAMTVTPPEILKIQSGERVNLTLTMIRNSDLAEGEHRIDLAFSANHRPLGQIDLRVDTRMHETPGDKGMIRLAKGNLRPAPGQWQYLAYIAVPVLVLVAWWRFRRRER